MGRAGALRGWARRNRGWIRLWVVATLIGVPAGAIYDGASNQAIWNAIDSFTVSNCVESVHLKLERDAIECARRQHAYEPAYIREHTTFAAYWGWRLVGWLILDCVLTLFLIGAAYVGRWVYRGFRPPAA